MRYADIKFPDIANGSGVRVSLWTQGCERHCHGCHNWETWDINGGSEFTALELSYINTLLSKDYVHGLSILGGEPLLWANTLTKICEYFKWRFPNKDIWLWTGYKWEQVKDKYKTLWRYVDVVVDGEYIEELRDIRLPYMGSSNQRVIYIHL